MHEIQTVSPGRRTVMLALAYGARATLLRRRDALRALAELQACDARRALNALEIAALTTPPGEDGSADLKYVLEAARSGTSSYGEMATYMDGAISKVVLSQTMTTDNGSSKFA